MAIHHRPSSYSSLTDSTAEYVKGHEGVALEGSYREPLTFLPTTLSLGPHPLAGPNEEVGLSKLRQFCKTTISRNYCRTLVFLVFCH